MRGGSFRDLEPARASDPGAERLPPGWRQIDFNRNEIETKDHRDTVGREDPVQAVEAASAKAPAAVDAPANEAAVLSPKSTKQEQVLTMLSQAGGVTIDEVMKATGWQQHSVRGFFAGTVSKKLGFELTSDKPEGEERRYSIKVAA